MFLVPWTNAVDGLVGLQQVLLAEKFMSLLAAGISAQHFPGKTLALFFLHAARHRIHLQQFAGLIRLRLFRVRSRSQSQYNAENHFGTHADLPRKGMKRTPLSRTQSPRLVRYFVRRPMPKTGNSGNRPLVTCGG